MAERRYPMGPLLRAFGEARVWNPHCQGARWQPSTSPISELLGMSYAALRHYRQRGVPESKADRFAVLLGFHPSEIWDDWFVLTDMAGDAA